MKWFFLVLMLTPAYAGDHQLFTDSPDVLGKYVIGSGCGSCHDSIPKNAIPHVDALLEASPFDDAPIGDVFMGYEHHTPTPPATPLPGTLWLLAGPLLWIGRKALKRGLTDGSLQRRR